MLKKLKYIAMNSEIISKIKNKLKRELRDKDILDVILFGSTIKGKASPEDIDIAILTEKQFNLEIKGAHISLIKPKDFFVNPPSIAHTLLREGYSLKNNKYLAENLKFNNKVLFTYSLTNLNASKKVKIVNILRGKNKQKGMIEEYNGEWLANQVFTIPVEKSNIFEKFFINFEIRFTKSYILIH